MFAKSVLALLGLCAVASADTAANATIEPLITSIFTADPSAHVFNGKLYVYPSHDRNNSIPSVGNGNHYDMVDYHVLSMDKVGGPVKDNGIALALEDIPWALKQLWAPDAAKRDGEYFLFFPARNKSSVFRIGVATSRSPVGPFKADPEPIPVESCNKLGQTDPAIFIDDDQEAYLYFGGNAPIPLFGNDTLAYGPNVAILSRDLHGVKVPPQEIKIFNETGHPLLADDHERRFFEAAYMHKYKGKYYLSYSTGDTHFMVYAIGKSPLGPFTYAGRILDPVVGWTTHGSIVEFKGKWYLFYHDSECFGGVDYLRCVKVREIFYDKYGKIHLTRPTPSPHQGRN